MSNYYDPVAEAETASRERTRRRSRLTAVVRGWLRMHAWPKCTMMLLLAVSAVPAVWLGLWARTRGLGPGFCVMYSAPAWWAGFVTLLRLVAHLMWRQISKQQVDARASERVDELALQLEAATIGSLPGKESVWNQPGVRQAVDEGFGRAMGEGGFFGLLLFGSLTAGLWILWELIASGPDVLGGHRLIT